MIRKRLAPVLSVEALPAPGHYLLTFQDADIARDARPGHFIAVSAAAPANPGGSILRKPFSIFTADPETGVCSILFSLYGPTTKTMASFTAGDTLDLIGPLGGRVFEPATGADVHHVMVGGGYGVPPLNFLAKWIRHNDPSARVTLIHGARSANLLVGAEGLQERGIDVIACTDDGSFGVEGKVTVALEPLLVPGTVVYTCGPTPMMRAVAENCVAQGIACQVSMETPMPCGIGICVGCVIPRPDGSFSRTCTDGPVYPALELVWP